MDRHCVAVLSVLVFALSSTHSRIFEPAEFARTLHQLKVSDWDIPTFVCLAHNASELNTNTSHVMALRPLRRNVTFYGIFGIPEIWLSSCSLKPEELMDDDVSDDVKCVHDQLMERLSFFDRTDNLGALTPHIVDLDKCFNWWEKLPRFSISEFGTSGATCPPPDIKTKVQTDSEKPSASKQVDNSAKKDDNWQKLENDLYDRLNRTQHQTPSVCKCTADSRSFVVEISLVFLNCILIAICYILWSTFVQRRRIIDAESVQFVNPHSSMSL
ncbi:lysozyme [Nesidiocoris tenuis]|uniref:Lysozyme n=1 Tax=Nesidiocoris tenuis TaxID=355587 RepID=A0ABN7A9K1_9HEMI|nr:lysozyme [Nesidiocoris tenuis]